MEKLTQFNLKIEPTINGVCKNCIYAEKTDDEVKLLCTKYKMITLRFKWCKSYIKCNEAKEK